MSTFRQLCAQHKDRIYTFAYYYLGNQEDAEDITQEVLLRLWDNLPRLDVARTAAWITRVARNACIDAQRQRRRYRTVAYGAEEALLAQTPDTRPGPSEEMAAADFRRQLEAALLCLDEPYRSIVVLREIQGLEYQEISTALELPLNTVKVYLHRGRQRLRQYLKKSVHDEQK